MQELMTHELISWLAGEVPEPPQSITLEKQNYQASGAGGQKRNRKLSGIRLSMPQFNLVINCCEERSTERNLQIAMRRIKCSLALSSSINPPPDVPFQFPGSAGRISESNPRYPLFLLYARNRLQEAQGNPAPAASQLGISTSALVRLVFADKQLLNLVQHWRKERGLPPLKR